MSSLNYISPSTGTHIGIAVQVYYNGVYNEVNFIMLTTATNNMIIEITATTMPATIPASRPLLEIPVPTLGVSGAPVKDKKMLI